MYLSELRPDILAGATWPGLGRADRTVLDLPPSVSCTLIDTWVKERGTSSSPVQIDRLVSHSLTGYQDCKMGRVCLGKEVDLPCPACPVSVST